MNILKITIGVSILLGILSGCGYKAIYSIKNQENFEKIYISKIEVSGDRIIKQTITNNLLFLTRLIIHVQATIPVINAAINPTLITVIDTSSVVNSLLNKSFAILPKISGTTIKKENRAAFSLSTPRSTEVPIVAPDLDIPGNIAMA